MIEELPEHRVVPERVSDEPIEAARLGGRHHPLGERDPDALPLPLITNDQPHFDPMLVERGKAAERHDLGSVGHLQFRDQSQPPPVVDARQQTDHRVRQRRHLRKESEISRPRAQMIVELAHDAAFAPAQRTDPQPPTVRELEVPGKLDWVHGSRSHRDRLSWAVNEGVLTSAMTNSTHSTKSGTAVVSSAEAIRSLR